ncbi:anti-sigma factor family protein [Gordonia crocea]|uniref:anti-sigma factor family protein n=1 Tax=Gordonia crocea TaxID=589162 RepID=UPI00137A3312|nr:hypothetical protein [Gordonia crocea]
MSEMSRVFPEPPFAPELIADLHAGALEDDLATHIRSRLDADPDARDLLESLDATVDALGGLPAPAVTVPEEVRAASERTLARLAQQRSAPAAPRPRHGALLLGAAAGVCVVAAGVAVAALMSPGNPASPDSADEVAAAETASLLAAVRAPQSVALDANRLARCLTANRLGDVGVVGAGYLTYRGRPAQVILTPTGQAGRFNALVTTRDCDAGKPGTLARAVVTE